MSDLTGWWSIPQTARYLGVSSTAVQLMLSRGYIRGTTTPWGKRFRWWVDPTSVPTPEERVRHVHQVNVRNGRALGVQTFAPKHELLEEYTFFRSIGMSHRAAAERLADAYNRNLTHVLNTIHTTEKEDA